MTQTTRMEEEERNVSGGKREKGNCDRLQTLHWSHEKGKDREEGDGKEEEEESGRE